MLRGPNARLGLRCTRRIWDACDPLESVAIEIQSRLRRVSVDDPAGSLENAPAGSAESRRRLLAQPDSYSDDGLRRSTPCSWQASGALSDAEGVSVRAGIDPYGADQDENDGNERQRVMETRWSPSLRGLLWVDFSRSSAASALARATTFAARYWRMQARLRPGAGAAGRAARSRRRCASGRDPGGDRRSCPASRRPGRRW
jgi:hypothetical protein